VSVNVDIQSYEDDKDEEIVQEWGDYSWLITKILI
jgi:hypothetical protein